MYRTITSPYEKGNEVRVISLAARPPPRRPVSLPRRSFLGCDWPALSALVRSHPSRSVCPLHLSSSPLSAHHPLPSPPSFAVHHLPTNATTPSVARCPDVKLLTDRAANLSRLLPKRGAEWWTAHWPHFQTQQRDTVGENCWKANIVDFCRLQTAVRWQRLPRQRRRKHYTQHKRKGPKELSVIPFMFVFTGNPEHSFLLLYAKGSKHGPLCRLMKPSSSEQNGQTFSFLCFRIRCVSSTAALAYFIYISQTA